MMEQLKFTESFIQLLEQAIRTYEIMEASSLLLSLEGPIDWVKLRKFISNVPVIIVTSQQELCSKAMDHGFKAIHIHLSEAAPVFDRMASAILESVANDLLLPGSRIIALYSGFDPTILDSISVINLGEHLECLSSKELRKLETIVPLKTLKTIVDMALDIGRDGREGKNIGTLFVVGDVKNVLPKSRPGGFDPVFGYKTKERSIFDKRTREGIKEIAQLDGAIIISSDGIVMAACRMLDTSTAMVTLSKGLGARHWAAAAVSRATNAIAIVVSQTSGTIRIFFKGEVVLRIESRHHRPMIWKDFE